MKEYDKALSRKPSEEPPFEELDLKLSYEKAQHTLRWRHRGIPLDTEADAKLMGTWTPRGTS